MESLNCINMSYITFQAGTCFTTQWEVLDQRFSNYGHRTTCSSRGLPSWSFKKSQKEKSKWIANHTIPDISVWKWPMAIAFHFSPSTDILWNLLPYPSTEFPLYSQQQKINVMFLSIFSLHIWRPACNPARYHPNSYLRIKVLNLLMYLWHS